jgi:hypothetical protein
LFLHEYNPASIIIPVVSMFGKCLKKILKTIARNVLAVWVPLARQYQRFDGLDKQICSICRADKLRRSKGVGMERSLTAPGAECPGLNPGGPERTERIQSCYAR